MGLTENYAGGSLLELCSSCVSKVPADGLHITTSQRISTAIGDKLLVGDYVHEDLAMTVSYMGAHGVNQYLSTVQKTSAGTNYGDITNPNNSGGNAADIAPATAADYKRLFKIVNGNALGFKGAKVIESSVGATFQYVSQCSNRGNCDASSGLCVCHKGYSGDSCDTQNMMGLICIAKGLVQLSLAARACACKCANLLACIHIKQASLALACVRSHAHMGTCQCGAP